MLLTAAAVVAIVVIALILWGALRRPRANPGGLGDESFIALGGVAIPAVILLAVAVATLYFAAEARPAESSSSGALSVEIVGHQYWWEVSYPDLGIVTANEVHIPVGQPVDLTLRSADVLHSFWVPQLAGKQDLVPGVVNHLQIRADEPGDYWGVCAEFCGAQHGNMGFVVFADDDDDFDAWTRDQQTIDETSDPAATRGAEVFVETACAGCHTVRGTSTEGELGPDLTELGDRTTIGAGVLDNTSDNLRWWITSVDEIKPGALMLPFQLSDDDLDALVAFLEQDR